MRPRRGAPVLPSLEIHDGHSFSTPEGIPATHALDKSVSRQVGPDGLLESPGAFSVNDRYGGQAAQRGFVDGSIHNRERFVYPQPDDVHFPARPGKGDIYRKSAIF